MDGIVGVGGQQVFPQQIHRGLVVAAAARQHQAHQRLQHLDNGVFHLPDALLDVGVGAHGFAVYMVDGAEAHLSLVLYQSAGVDVRLHRLKIGGGGAVNQLQLPLHPLVDKPDYLRNLGQRRGEIGAVEGGQHMGGSRLVQRIQHGADGAVDFLLPDADIGAQLGGVLVPVFLINQMAKLHRIGEPGSASPAFWRLRPRVPGYRNQKRNSIVFPCPGGWRRLLSRRGRAR